MVLMFHSFVIDQADDTVFLTGPFDSHSVTIASDALGTLSSLVKVEVQLKQLWTLLLLVIFGTMVRCC